MMNDGIDFDHNIGDAVDGPVDIVGRDKVVQTFK